MGLARRHMSTQELAVVAATSALDGHFGEPFRQIGSVWVACQFRGSGSLLDLALPLRRRAVAKTASCRAGRTLAQRHLACK